MQGHIFYWLREIINGQAEYILIKLIRKNLGKNGGKTGKMGEKECIKIKSPKYWVEGKNLNPGRIKS